jgi:hypothetical protein
VANCLNRFQVHLEAHGRWGTFFRHFLDNKAGGHQIKAEPAIFLWHAHRPQTGVPQWVGGLLGELGLSVVIRRSWPDVALGDFSGPLFPFLLFGGQGKVIHRVPLVQVSPPHTVLAALLNQRSQVNGILEY